MAAIGKNYKTNDADIIEQQKTTDNRIRKQNAKPERLNTD